MIVTAQVMRVRPLGHGFGVTLGPPPRFLYVVTSDPPRLGASVQVSGRVVETRELKDGFTWERVDGEILVDTSSRDRRVVYREWSDRAALVWSRELYSYQLEGAAWLASRLAAGQGAILADSPGLGKTSQVLAAILATQSLPALVVCPLTLKQEWLNEIQHAKEDVKVEILSGRNGFVHPAHVYLINYDILKSREAQVCLMGCKSVIFDEAQALINHAAGVEHRAAVATRVAHRIGRAIALTGTPLLNHVREYWRLLHLVDPMSWPSFEVYAERYCRLPTEDEFREDPSTGSRVVTTHGRAERVKELQSRVEHVMLRRTKEEVKDDLPPLPPKVRRVVEVDLEPEDQAFYDKTRDDLASWYVATGKHLPGASRQSEALRRLGVLRQIATMGKTRRAIPDYFADWFSSAIVKPLVVFGYHKKPLAIVEELAKKMGLRAGVIRTAGPYASEDERKKTVDAFRAGETDLLLAPIRAAGVGLNLQNAADALFLEWTWVPADLEQAENRIHRIGQDKNVTITYLLARGTIDVHMAALVLGKQVLIDNVLDGVCAAPAK